MEKEDITPESLDKTLQQEKAALGRLIESFELQLAAIRKQEMEALEEATLKTSKEVQQLTILKHERRKQMMTLWTSIQDDVPDSLEKYIASWPFEENLPGSGQHLQNTYSAIQELVEDARTKGSELAYTLQYALHLGREMLLSIQGYNIPPPIQLYNSRGETSKSQPTRSFVNKIG